MKRNCFLIRGNQLGQEVAEKIVNECNNSDYWHKFIVQNVTNYEDHFIIKTILDFLRPIQLTPVNFCRKKKAAAFFMASNCLDAIMKLVLNDLQIPNPLNETQCIHIKIWANFSPLDTFNVHLADNVKHIVQKRLCNKTLDLTEFHKDPELKGFCALSDPKSFTFVMHFVINLEPKNIILAKNSIKRFEAMTYLRRNTLTALDLQGNQVTTFEDLQPLTHFPALREIFLDGNPICRNDKKFYVENIKKLFPKITHIDNIPINGITIDKIPSPKNNFLCSLDAGDLAEQFLEYFFTAYDEYDRSGICDLYHENALFSVSCRIIPEQASIKSTRLSHYFAINRSLYFRCNSGGPKDTFLFQGRENIMELFKKLPRSQHDPYKIKTDVIYYTEKHAIIIVHGVFREGPQYFGFSRNFILECDDKQQYCIKNEQLHVYNAMDDQVNGSFVHPKRIQFACEPTPFLSEQYFQLQETYRLITNLNIDYSRRFLEQFHYDLESALTYFTNLYINNNLPKDAFVRKRKPKRNKRLANPHSNELIAKVVKNKGLLTNTTLWEMLTDERLAMRAKKKQQDILSAKVFDILRARQSKLIMKDK